MTKKKHYKFTCELCQKEITVKHPQTPEELKKEMIATFGDFGEEQNNNVAQICDDCWLKLQHKQTFGEKFVKQVEKVVNMGEERIFARCLVCQNINPVTFHCQKHLDQGLEQCPGFDQIEIVDPDNRIIMELK